MILGQLLRGLFEKNSVVDFNQVGVIGVMGVGVISG